MQKPNVMFVDDEIRVVRSLKAYFSLQNEFNILTATSGAQALENLHNNRVHIIVSDERMPGMNGVELLRQVRQISPNTLGILLTGYADLNAILASINEGEVFRFVTKPWRNQDLHEKIQQGIRIARNLFEVKTSPQQETSAMVPFEAKDLLPPSILVVHPADDREIPELVRRQANPSQRVQAVSRIDDAVDCLAEDEFAVMVADMSGYQADMAAAIRKLKQVNPAILTIAVTHSADANVAIALINQGQVYRFLPKPVQPGRMKLSIASALMYSARMRATPVMVQRHQVEIHPDDNIIPELTTRLTLAAPEAVAGNSLRQRLERVRQRFLQGRFAKFLGS